MKLVRYIWIIALVCLSCTQSRPIDLESLASGLNIYYTDVGVDSWYTISDVKVLRRKPMDEGFELIELEYKLNFKQSSQDYIPSHESLLLREFVIDKDLENISANQVLTIRENFKIKEFEKSYTMEAASVAESF